MQRILVRGGVAREVETSRDSFPCDHLVSSIPIRLLPRMIDPLPGDAILEAADSLRFRAIVCVGLLVSKPAVLPVSFMYFRDKTFNRVTDLGRFGVETTPAGATLLVAELTCQPEDEAWKNDETTATRVVSELVSEGFFRAEEILEKHVFKTPYGYPIYRLGYEKALRTVLDGLETYRNIHSIGRQGRFAFVNTHVAMKMGFDAARRIDAIANEKVLR